MFTHRPSWFVVACGTLVAACGGALPSAPSEQAVSLKAASVTCGLSASPTDVSLPGSTTFEITGSGLPADAVSYWNGTKDGVTDAVDQPTWKPYATGKFPILYTVPSEAGEYVRYAVIKDSAGHTLCTTGSVRVVFRKPATRSVACSLTASRTMVPPFGDVTLTIKAAPLMAGDMAFWYGTKDGTPDAPGTPFGAGSGSVIIHSSPGFEGTYTRYAVLRDAAGNDLCTTSTVTVTLL